MHCIARAFSSQPLARLVVENAGRVAYVIKPSHADAIKTDQLAGVSFPLWDLFEYDSTLVDELVAAFESGDADTLETLWGHAKPLPI